MKLRALATQGTQSDDEVRLRALLSELPAEFLPFDRQAKLRSGWAALQDLRRHRPDLLVLEGTGLAGGLAAILAKILFGVPYVLSSGDAIGPFIAGQHPALGPVFSLYERLLCANAAGFVGWTPYLTGRALSLGAPRGMTAPGWAPATLSTDQSAIQRQRIREALGIGEGERVIGIVGSLQWNRRVNFCYGKELVDAMLKLAPSCRVRAVVVGDGSGLEKLKRLAAPLGPRVIFTGRVPRDEVPAYLAAFDLASLPQSLDQVGSFRYTTKLSEYLAARLPVVTGRIPLAYDLPGDWLWRLPGKAPWDPRYIDALAQLLTELSNHEWARKRAGTDAAARIFERVPQIARMTAFISEIVADLKSSAERGR